MSSPTTPIIPAGTVATPVVPTSQPPVAPLPGQGTGLPLSAAQSGLLSQAPIRAPVSGVSVAPPVGAPPATSTGQQFVSNDGGRTWALPSAPIGTTPPAPVSSIPPVSTSSAISGTPTPVQPASGRQPAPAPIISGTPAQVPDYAETLPPEQRLATPSGRPLAAGERESAVLNMFNAGITDPASLQRYFNVSQSGTQPSAYSIREIQGIIASQARPGTQPGTTTSTTTTTPRTTAAGTAQQQITQTQAAITSLQSYIASSSTAPSVREDVLSLQRALDSVSNGVITSNFADNVRATIGRVLTSLNSQAIPPLPDFSSAIAATQARLAELGTRINDPTVDPMFRLALAREQEIEQDRLEATRRIEVTGTRQYDEQVELNKQAIARSQVAMAGARLTGSPIAADYLTSVINQGQKILRNINEDIQKAITDANSSFRQQKYEISVQKIDYIEKLKDKRDMMVNQQLDLSQKLYEAQTQRVEMQNQMEERYYQRQRNVEEDRRIQKQDERQEKMDTRAIAKEDRSYAMADMELFLKGNVDSSALSDEIYEDLGKKLGRTGTEAKKLYSGLIAEKTAEEASKKAKSDSELNQARLTALRAEREIASSLNPGEKINYTQSDGKVKSITGAFNLRDAKQYQVETSRGRELVTVDLSGKEIGRTRLGENYVAPKYDEDTHEWRAYDPLRDSEDTIQDNGPYDEGVKVYTTGKDIVSKFTSKFGKPSQEPGGSFTHGNSTSWDYMMKVGTPIDSPVSGVVVEARSGVTQQYNHPSKGNVDFGNYVEILDEATGMRVRMAHFKDMNLKKGDRINAGTLLGHSGHTGCSTGPHLHMEFLTSEGKAISPNNKAALEKKFMLGGDVHGRAKESQPQAQSKTQTTGSNPFRSYEEATGIKLNPKSDRDKAKVAQFKLDQRKTTDTNEDLSVTEAKELGVPYGTSKAEAKKKGIMPKAADKPPTVDQSSNAGFAGRVKQSMGELDSLEKAISGTGYLESQYQRNVPNPLKSSEFQQQERAERAFINANLRRESGAAIAPHEFESYRKEFLPVPGDKTEVLERKKKARETALQGLVLGAGSALSEDFLKKAAPYQSINPGVTKVGDSTTVNGLTYVWDGSNWKTQ